MVIDTQMLRIKLQKDKDRADDKQNKDTWGIDQFDNGISYECRNLLQWLNELEGKDNEND